MTGIGHIGAGGMARGRAGELLKEQDVRMVIGWSRGETNRREYAKLTGGEPTDDWRAVIDHPDVQAVCIGTPTATHADYAVAALDAGRHALVECPAAGSLSDFDRMADAAERNGVALYIASNYRFDANSQAMAYAVRHVGRVLLAQGDSSWVPRSAAKWYFDRALSGGLFPCVHLYQLTVFSCLGPARWVDAELSEDGRHGVAMVRYESGAVGLITGGYERFGANDFLLVGTEGMARRDSDGAFVIAGGEVDRPVPTQPPETTREDNAAFLRCVRGEEDWRPHAESERAIHAAAIAAQQAAESGRRVAF